MLDAVSAFFRSLRAGVRRGFGLLFAAIAWPFMAAHGWYRDRGFVIKAVVGVVLVLLAVFYASFLWSTQRWTDFDPDFPARYDYAARTADAGQELPSTAGAAKTCQTSAIVDTAADLIRFNVDDNAWISSTLAYRAGFFGIDWDHTPFLDNKASFQRGVNQAVRRTAVELVDSLGRMRGTSGVNQDLQDARGNLQFDEYSWYFGLSPFGPKTPTPSYYRAADKSLRKFNVTLAACGATFDPAPTISCSSSIASPMIWVRPRPFWQSVRKTIIAAGWISAPMTVSGSPMASFTAITACFRQQGRISRRLSASAT